MDPITIGLLLASVAGGALSASSAKKSASESLDWQKKRAAEQDRFAQAARTDAFGNRISYDQALNEWITQLTPEQKALMFAGESEQRRALTEDAARNRMVRERQYRAGTLAQPGFDEALARLRFDQPESEESIRAKIAQLLTLSKGSRSGGRQGQYQEIRQAGNVPMAMRSPEGDTGASELAKTLLQARGAARGEAGSRAGATTSRYGDALSRYAGLLGGGGGAPIGMPSTAKDLEGQQSEMARLVASIGQSGSQNVGRAQEGALKAASINPIDARSLASIYAASRRGTAGGGRVGVGARNVGSATRFGDDLYASDRPYRISSYDDLYDDPNNPYSSYLL